MHAGRRSARRVVATLRVISVRALRLMPGRYSIPESRTGSVFGVSSSAFSAHIRRRSAAGTSRKMSSTTRLRPVAAVVRVVGRPEHVLDADHVPVHHGVAVDPVASSTAGGPED